MKTYKEFYPCVTTRIFVTLNALDIAGMASRRIKVRCSSLSATMRQRSPETLMLWMRLIRRSNSSSPNSSRSIFRPGINWGFSFANRFSIGENGTVTTRASRATTKFSSFSPGTTKSGLISTTSRYIVSEILNGGGMHCAAACYTCAVSANQRNV